jgi:hypothetical protein
MIETLIGTALGGLFRVIPEGLKILDRHNERKHEATMLTKTIEADKMKAELNFKTTTTAKEFEALVTATKAQSKRSGIKWIDGINSLMRPILTFWWCIALNTGVMVSQYLVLTSSGADVTEAILALWGAPEKAIVASIISFWFVDRSLRKGYQK